MSNVARELLKGAIDTHIHTAPDVLPRLRDDHELAQGATDAGMAAIVIKSHHMLTADRAQLAQKLYPNVKVFGGLALNLPASGGLNPDAVRVALRMGAKIIWLPTLSAANHIEGIKTKALGNLGKMSAGFAPTPVEVLGEDGAVVPALKEIFALIAEADVILATGHLSVAEIKKVADAAQQAGVRKILVNHPELFLVGMGIEDQQELAAKGVMLERCIRNGTSSTNEGFTPKNIAEQIKAVGVESTVMATDFGQMDAAPAAHGQLFFIEQMLEYGLKPEEIEVMVKVNPGRLLGL